MLWFFILFIGFSGLSTGHNSERPGLQITVPKRIRAMVAEGVASHLSYRIAIGGKEYTVNLMQKTFVPYNFRVYSYNGTQSMKPVEQKFQNYCYYQGYIEGHPKSMAILSTCAGLRGLLQFQNISYGIEPLEPSIGFEHIIYQIKHKDAGLSLYSEEDIESETLPYKTKRIKTFKQSSQYIEMHIVVEKKLYEHMGSDIAVVTEKVFHLVGIINAIFTSFNITILLSSVELWIDENKIPVTGDANQLMHKFLKWKRSYLVLRPHDVAFLLVYREKPDHIGATFEGKICDKKYGGGVALYSKSLSLESLAVVLAQLLSLNMGISYDDINKCHCSGTICIMNPEAIHSSGVKTFSNCSLEDFAHFSSMPESNCLQNKPRLGPAYQEIVEMCGNGIKEEGEECDCGSEEECKINLNACCRSNCTFIEGGQCDMGECCLNCRFSSAICRQAKSLCDIQETCNGSHTDCPEDIYIHNGRPCGYSNKWICFGGECVNGDEQCNSLFRGSHFGSNECFNYLNSFGDISGGCNEDTTKGYTKCKPGNEKCGKLVCSMSQSLIFHVIEASIFYANKSGNICLSLNIENTTTRTESFRQKMWTKPGTVCDTNKHCEHHECINSEDLGYNDCQKNCTKYNMTCNSNKKCVKPTDADEELTYEIIALSGENVVPIIYPSTRKTIRWPIFLFILFFILLIVLIVNVLKVRGQRKKWKTEEYTNDE